MKNGQTSMTCNCCDCAKNVIFNYKCISLIKVLPCPVLESLGYKLHFKFGSRSIYMGLDFIDPFSGDRFPTNWKIHQCPNIVLMNWFHLLFHGVNPFCYLGCFTITNAFNNNFCYLQHKVTKLLGLMNWPTHMHVWSFMNKNNFKLNSKALNIIKVVKFQRRSSS